MRRGRGPVGDVARTVAMSRLRVGDVADHWHGVPGYAQTAANVVSCDVVRHQSEERRQRARAAAGTGAWQLRRRPGLGCTSCGGAMVRPGRDCLTGTVEVDETYVGGPEEGKRGRGWRRGRQSTPTDGAGIPGWRTPATSTRSPSSATVWIQPTKSCRGFTLWSRFSSGGCSALTRAASSNNTSITTSTNSLFGSTGDAQMLAGCCSTGSPSRRLRSSQRLTIRLSVTPGRRNNLTGVKEIPIFAFYAIFVLMPWNQRTMPWNQRTRRTHTCPHLSKPPATDRSRRGA